MRVHYFYEWDDKNRPVKTRCVLYEPSSNLVGFGQAVCSDKDNPNKKIGKAIAEGRAKKVLRAEKAHPAIPFFTRKGQEWFVKQCRSPHFHVNSVLNEKELTWVHNQLNMEQEELCM